MLYDPLTPEELERIKASVARTTSAAKKMVIPPASEKIADFNEAGKPVRRKR